MTALASICIGCTTTIAPNVVASRRQGTTLSTLGDSRGSQAGGSIKGSIYTPSSGSSSSSGTYRRAGTTLSSLSTVAETKRAGTSLGAFTASNSVNKSAAAASYSSNSSASVGRSGSSFSTSALCATC